MPDEIELNGRTYKVTSVSEGAFEDLEGLRTVTIGQNVNTIGERAFSGCENLARLILNTRVLQKEGVKGCLKGSSVRKISVKVGPKKKDDRFFRKDYKKIFTKKNCGKRVKVTT